MTGHPEDNSECVFLGLVLCTHMLPLTVCPAFIKGLGYMVQCRGKMLFMVFVWLSISTFVICF